ncbi:MAG TPA: hypothetical protein VK501_14365 [Baekduia sp.]|uniref:hypothetical protein n=1 Tax=Baekduia sp. TaxID=2600305 RepID=UPI002C5B8D02|nr:hypothetical protein [Baekduia sp.]HMJ35091.1 hypothetical protein [Baekduia sp.]
MANAADPIDDLYGVDPEEFVSARTALAKRLRADGDRKGADAVKKLAKPTRAAWAVNRLARDRPEEIRALVDAGEALAGAQEQLLDGADAGVLRGAAEAARRLVDALADEAPVEGPARDKVRATLHAATVDEDVRQDVAAGRVVRERSASGFGGLDALLASGFEARATPSRKGEGRKKQGAAKAEEPVETTVAPEPRKPDAREVRRRRDALRRAKEAEAKAEDAVTGAQRSLDQVESTIEARRRDLAEAQSALTEARDRRERAERAAAED